MKTNKFNYNFSTGPTGEDSPEPSTAIGEKREDKTAFSEHEVKDAYETLHKAENIKANEDLMSQIREYSGKQVKMHKKFMSVSDLRKHREKMNSGMDEEKGVKTFSGPKDSHKSIAKKKDESRAIDEQFGNEEE